MPRGIERKPLDLVFPVTFTCMGAQGEFEATHNFRSIQERMDAIKGLVPGYDYVLHRAQPAHMTANSNMRPILLDSIGISNH